MGDLRLRGTDRLSLPYGTGNRLAEYAAENGLRLLRPAGMAENDEWLAWYRLIPAQRWRESEKLWAFFLMAGDSLEEWERAVRVWRLPESKPHESPAAPPVLDAVSSSREFAPALTVACLATKRVELPKEAAGIKIHGWE